MISKEAQEVWNGLASNYEELVYSPTKSAKKRSLFREEIHEGDRILIAGGGSPTTFATSNPPSKGECFSQTKLTESARIFLLKIYSLFRVMLLSSLHYE